ncbi:hypothetical protein K488DRAFT_25632, partial [Vararia minispora EC-137]
ALALVSTGLFAVYYFDSRSALHRYVLTPALRTAFDPETAHRIAVRALGSGIAPCDMLPDNDVLQTELWGVPLANPLGIAAGFDKDGEAVDGLFDLGFSWVEIGSVTPKPQFGNPKPRVFRLEEDKALVNRYGFPSTGHTAVLARLRAREPAFPPTPPLPASQRAGALLAVNLGKNKDSAADSTDDYVAGIRAFAPHADVLVINVSSPNTPGLRALQARDALRSLLADAVRARDAAAAPHRPRLVLKVAPDLSEQQARDVAEAMRATPGVDGVIVSNTTVQRPAGLTSPTASESGGLSGPPLLPLTLQTLRTLRTHLPANTPILACGGIRTASDALSYARAGAAAVQMYTALAYDGPGAPRRIKDELAEKLREEGRTWKEVVESAVERLAWRPEETDKEDAGKQDVRQLIREAEELR